MEQVENKTLKNDHLNMGKHFYFENN